MSSRIWARSKSAMAVLAPDTLDKRDRVILNDAGFPLCGEDMAH